MSIGDPLRSALSVRRAEINARFAALRSSYPALEEAAVFAYLADTVSPIVAAVHGVAPGAILATLDALCELGFPLVAQGWLGPRARSAELATGFTHLLTRLPHLVAEDPTRFSGSIMNALYHLTRIPGARVNEWLALTHRLAEKVDLTISLQLGQVAAWRCGMAQLRSGALGLLSQLPPELAARAIGAPTPLTGEDIARLTADPWLAPAHLHEADGGKRLRQVGKAGGFAGFGGAFRKPPRVACVDGWIGASDGGAAFRLYADVFGCILHPLAGDLPTIARGDGQISADGQLHFLDERASLPAPLACHDCADDGQTLAAVSDASHFIFVFARAA